MKKEESNKISKRFFYYLILTKNKKVEKKVKVKVKVSRKCF